MNKKEILSILVTLVVTVTVVGVALLLVFLQQENLKLNQIGLLMKSPSSLIETRNNQKVESEPSTATSSAEIFLVTSEAPCENSFTLPEIPTPVCYQNECTLNSDNTDNCPANSGLKCQQTSAGRRCVNPTCPNEQDCTCPASPTCYTNQCTINSTNNTDNCPSGLSCQNTSAGMRCVNSQCPQAQNCTCPANPTCYQNECTINADNSDNCPGELQCKEIGTHHYCVNPSCTTDTDCVCPTPTPTPKPGCHGTCNADSDCPDKLVCRTQNNAKRCVNAACWDSDSCVCPTYAPPKEPELPKAGGIPPTVLFAIGGIILVGLGLIF